MNLFIQAADAFIDAMAFAGATIIIGWSWAAAHQIRRGMTLREVLQHTSKLFF